MTDPFVLAVACDFMLHLMNRPNPLVIGADYPRAKLVEEFEKWAASRKLPPHYIDMKSFNDYWTAK